MLTEKQILEVREHLERAQNPIFYYDNDADGLCSYIIFRKFLGRGRGIAVRSFPDLDASYARKAQELNADYVFVLDKPVIAKEFIEEIDALQLPLVWIDHHELQSLEEDFEKKFSNFYVYNPVRNKGRGKSEEPVTYWAYWIAGRKEYIWLAVMGCVADHYLPDFSSEFGKRFREFWGDIKDPFDAYYGTEIGRIAQALNFGLKDSTTHIVQLQNFLILCKGPEEVFLEIPGNYAFRKRYREVRKKYDGLLEKAKKNVYGNLIFFDYAGDLSISSDVANELSYIFPGKYVIVAYRKGMVSNLSLRGNNVKKILESTLEKFKDATGGGHRDAVGARIKTEDLKEFREIFGKEVN